MLCCFAHREQQGLFKEQTKGNINNKVCRLNEFAMMMMMMMTQDGNDHDDHCCRSEEGPGQFSLFSKYA